MAGVCQHIPNYVCILLFLEVFLAQADGTGNIETQNLRMCPIVMCFMIVVRGFMKMALLPSHPPPTSLT